MGVSCLSVSRALFLLSVARSVIAGPYVLHQTNIGSDFLSNFQWENISDPTNGRVEYVTQETALAENLTYTTSDSFVMRADDTTRLSADGPGRKSNRIKSNEQYNTHVAVFDIRHMPEGCATWPALWEADDTVGTAAGEIDILEGVNDVEPDSVTVHTLGTCTMPSNRTMLGTSLSNDCSSSNEIENGNNGCSVNAPYTSSYGPTFNTYGGGYYAVERTAEFIRVWFWSRNGTNIPSDITSGSGSINTDNWGKPIADFPDTDCDISKVFGDNNIIIDLTFCGNWAGDAFNPAGCPGNCTDYVNNNPSAFSNAYWDFAAARIYLTSSSSSSNSSSSASKSMSATSVSSSQSASGSVSSSSKLEAHASSAVSASYGIMSGQGFMARLFSLPVFIALFVLGCGFMIA
ncbi:glycoside hydrolase family 16 protein [Laetiporus sulphureus 93-53]|uniref:Glycoside hydrolase family 16 protein n=1 Tax=Laetiporus sulphureus 93-53 TaxID=1314785 RepID=A0A165FQ03_9APHY|nr:glycoside hydrolase family 16 protein [Laetiporus sulphureus 93-53]KZT09301.1 glycoside hydrolase family 16 protein [Laetiporus sulphureus 93-53]